MFNLNFFNWRRRRPELDPDEVFIDSHNLPAFNNQQFEGRLETPIGKRAVVLMGLACLAVALVYLWQIGNLQLIRGSELADRSLRNSLRREFIFPKRGIIYDRLGQELAWNDPERKYITQAGFAHLLGYVGYPTTEELSAQNYDSKELIGRDGVEATFNNTLHGSKGVRIEEAGVGGQVVSDHVLQEPQNGRDLRLTIDARVQERLHSYISETVRTRGFWGGAGIIMDTQTGEILALTNYPEYNSNILSAGQDRAAIDSFIQNKHTPFLDRVIAGLYAPGSTVKPFMALAALTEGVITPEVNIYSAGFISIPNPYNPQEKTVFKDWKAHGSVDLRRALAVSSDVYFYEVGGGYQNQRGLGISNIARYMKMFGLGEKTGIDLGGEMAGVIPSPEWKAKVFNGEPWRLGDTYHTSIGQYGFLVSPIQMLRAVNAVATDGKLIKPTVVLPNSTSSSALGSQINIKGDYFRVVREGMRDGVIQSYGTVKGLNTPSVTVGSKTGTAELGVAKEMVNSWVTGFFPFEHPRYSFVVVMERGPKANQIGAVYVMRQLLDWMAVNTPDYLK